jgi:hypothetical protein
MLECDPIILAIKRMIGSYAITCQQIIKEYSKFFIESRGMLHNISFSKSNGLIIGFMNSCRFHIKSYVNSSIFSFIESTSLLQVLKRFQ